MLGLVAILSVCIFFQGFNEIKCYAIRQVGDSQGLSITPEFSIVTAIPTLAVGNGVPNNNSINTTPGSGSNLGSTTINILRRGTEFLADQIVTALGGVASLINVLENSSQNEDINLGNLGTTIQSLTSRLLNLGLNSATNILQELTNQVPPIGTNGITLRTNGLFTSGTRPFNRRTIFVNRAQAIQPVNDFNFTPIDNPDNFSELSNNEQGGLFLSQAESFGGAGGGETFSNFGNGRDRLFSQVESFNDGNSNNYPNFDNGRFSLAPISSSRIRNAASSIASSTGTTLNSLIESALSPLSNTSVGVSKSTESGQSGLLSASSPTPVVTLKTTPSTPSVDSSSTSNITSSPVLTTVQ